ncbi:MAG: hypothetical protein HGA25_07380 [Clostridiales bacterium]|nr:hypothetical protein [Clostridiales bacterium]
MGLIGGSKEAPRPIDELGNAILEDNVAVEFNIEPATTAEQFRASIHKVLDHIRSILPDYILDTASAVSFPEEELNTPQAQEFGCMPDFDAWRKCVNHKPHADDENLRSAGGHIHVGSNIAVNNPIGVIRAMDLFLGVPSLVLDSGTLRRKLYGKAGCFRLKPYGAEYRTLSNFWIFNDSLINWAYQGTQRALEFVSTGSVIAPEHEYMIQRCINTNDMNDYHVLKEAYGL